MIFINRFSVSVKRPEVITNELKSSIKVFTILVEIKLEFVVFNKELDEVSIYFNARPYGIELEMGVILLISEVESELFITEILLYHFGEEFQVFLPEILYIYYNGKAVSKALKSVLKLHYIYYIEVYSAVFGH